MSNTQNILTDLGDEALEPAPARQAYATFSSLCQRSPCVPNCSISDEPLDQVPGQEALTCGMCAVCVPCTISDEPLDPAPAQDALACTCVACAICGCGISDEVLDPAPAQQAQACACVTCSVGVSDEPLDPTPAQEALTPFPIPCILCTVSDEDVATR